MINKDFFFQQYNQLNWKNQEKTKINAFINNYIIENIILKHEGDNISVFDIGFGIGFFIKMLAAELVGKYKDIKIEGCEPSRVNYEYFADQKIDGITLEVYSTGFLETETSAKFDFITAIYVFPHFLSEDLELVAKKIRGMLNDKGQFILVLANEKYLSDKLGAEKDYCIESGEFDYRGKTYKEILHYSNIPEIGKVIDYNREEQLYLDIFTNNNFSLKDKEVLNDNGFICTLFVFEKNENEWDRLISHERHQINFDGINIVVEDGVFTPDSSLTYSAKMITDNLPDLTGMNMADVGTGTGVIATIGAKRGAANVVATDILSKAVDNALENFKLNRVGDKVKLVKTDLLEGVEEKFDLICANLPILEDVWTEQGLKVNNTIEKFLATTQDKLKAGGRIYLPWASFSEDKKKELEKTIENNGYEFSLKEVEKMGYVWYLYILKRPSSDSNL